MQGTPTPEVFVVFDGIITYEEERKGEGTVIVTTRKIET